MKKIAQTFVIAVALATFGTAALAAKSLLDGTKYQGVVKLSGSEKGDADSITFDNGIFHSEACDKYGFKPSAYSATKDASGIHFETVSKTDSGTTQVWKGTVNGDRIEAKLTWSDGKLTKEYAFAGQRAK